MASLDRKQVREVVEEYFCQHPNATIEEIAGLPGVTKQRGHIILRLLGTTPQKHRGDYSPEILTKHETKILRYVAGGMTNKQIADIFGLTESTIKSHVTVILAKLNANNRAHAVTLAILQGLISLDHLRATENTSK